MPTANSLYDILNELKHGRLIILTDRPDREGEADLFLPAVHATPETINFMIREGRGLVCAPITQAWAQRLRLPLMVAANANQESHRCQFTVSVDARHGVTTGISAADRATTIRRLADPHAHAAAFVRPGHVFPLVAATGGLTERDGHTEAAVALCELAGLPPVGVICELLNPDGSMARGWAVTAFAQKNRLAVLPLADLPRITPGVTTPPLPAVRVAARANLPTAFGVFTLHVFTTADSQTHVTLTCGNLTPPEPVLVRLHSRCLTGDTFHALTCDCHGQLHTALTEIGRVGRGILIYLNQEGRGIGLVDKIRAYALQEQGLDTVEANLALGRDPDERDYRVAADILRHFGIQRVELLTNNPEKISQLQARGIAVVRRPLVAFNGVNRSYLNVKASKLGHQIVLD